MLPAQALRGSTAVALDKMAAGEELTEQEEAIVRDLDGATPEEIRESLDAEGDRRPAAFAVKFRHPFGPGAE